MSLHSTEVPAEGIAIIGMAGRFPGAKSIHEFWENLCSGQESVCRLSDEELLASGVGEETLRDPCYVKRAGLLDDVEMFDAEFFRYSPREAEVTDPQQRLFLECAWHAVEDAGWNLSQFSRPVGIFAGAGTNTYLYNLYGDPSTMASLDSNQVTIGNEREYLTSRIAYKLDCRGPAVTVQTACSTSLVAVHLASQSLLSYECDMALAGGSLVCAQRTGYLYVDGGFLSPDGRNRSFDSEANGSVGGNGVCVVVLRRLEDALRDGDNIYAVIKGSAINNDGALKAGFTAPGVLGQAEVVARAQAVAGIDPETVSYMEAHGTATALGDPTEIAAYKKAFYQAAIRKQFCAIGSVKTNIGHLGEASGAAALIKTALCLFHKKLVPSLHFKTPNAALDLENSPFYVNTRLADWPIDLLPRRAGVSSFGIGGTNAHVVLEEAPARDVSKPCTTAQLLVWSATTEKGLETLTRDLGEALLGNRGLNLADVAFTLQTGRQPFQYRRAAVCSTIDEGIAVFKGLSRERLLTAQAPNEANSVVFMFPGVGDHYVGMAEQLYEEFPFFRAVLDECFTTLDALMSCDPRAILYGKRGESDEKNTQRKNTRTIDLRRMLAKDRGAEPKPLNLTSHVHPILFSVEYALARQWMKWGVKPSLMIGYSLGEYVAACVAGVFSLTDALRLVTRRAQMIDALSPGAMLAVPYSEAAAQSLVSDEIFLAAHNAPNLCVLAGPEGAIADLEEKLARTGQQCRRVNANRAVHCRLMETLSPGVQELLRSIHLCPPSIPYVSSVTGENISAADATNPDYWTRHLTQMVQFSEGVLAATELGGSVFLEIGPGRSLASLVLQTCAGRDGPIPRVVSSLRHTYESGSDTENMLQTAGKLWLADVPIDWMALHNGAGRRRVSLPGYPFERQRYWIEPNSSKSGPPLGEQKNTDISDWFYVPVWKRSLAAPVPIIRQHSPVRRWLIFTDEHDIGNEVCERLRADEVTRVRSGDRFVKSSARSYTIDPVCRDHYEQLLTEVLAEHPTLAGIVHLWGIEDSSSDGPTYWNRAQERGFYSVLNLVSALRSAGVMQEVRISLVANHLFAVTEEECIAAEKSTIVGVAMVAQQENPQMSFRCVDIQMGSGKARGMVAERLVQEVQSDSRDLAVALRGTQRWARDYDPVHLSGPASQLALRSGGTYILTGGFGGVGLILADYLARTWCANLVLIGRSKLPGHDSPTAVAKDGSQPPLSRATVLQGIRERASGMMLVEANVADEKQMRDAFQKVVGKFGGVDGIFHLAGTAVVKTAEEISAQDCTNQFEAKIDGTYVLERLARVFNPAFCVLFSSNAAILGGLGFAAYAAANCFMDAFSAKANRSNPARWVSVNWDGWVLPGQEASAIAQNSSMARYVMRPNEGVEVLRRIIESIREPQVVVSRLKLNDRVRLWIRREGLFEKKESRKATSLTQHGRPDLSTGYVAPADDVETELSAVIGELLGVKEVGVHDSFFELGGNSLVALQLFARIRQQFEVELPLRTIFESPTVFRLKENIQAVRGDILGVLEEMEKEQAATRVTES
jgi:acyl transferase domain-containing protein/acyl carrier protein